MELQATPLKGIVRSSDEELFYLFPIQDVSALQQMKAHLTCAIDVLSHPEESSTEQRLEAVRTLNSMMATITKQWILPSEKRQRILTGGTDNRKSLPWRQNRSRKGGVWDMV